MQRYRTPFSAMYWREAAKETHNTTMWLFAALVTAMRIALKAVRIPLMQDLFITFGFLPNALGSMVYGPVLALLSAIVSDTVGALAFPVGPYFPPFALVEIMGSVIFAMFLYRAPVKIWRVAASKLTVSVLCNLFLTPIFLSWMSGNAAKIIVLPRIAKNVAMFPLESVMLVLLIDALLPALRRLGLVPQERARLSLTACHFIMLGGMTAIAAACVFAYVRLSF